MMSGSEIWIAFGRTFSVLLVVLALLIFVFYLIKRFSMIKGSNGADSLIRVLGMHHLSPKEKLVLLDVLGEKILIGVTPNRISSLSTIQTDKEFPEHGQKEKFRFSDCLARSFGGRSSNPDDRIRKKEVQQ